MFKPGLEGLEWVKERVVHSGGTLAVAFWGVDAIKQLGLATRPSRAGPLKIICNLSLGGTNPFEIERMIGLNGIVVEQSDRLHGKVYFFEDAALIGSSNASSNGLSFEGAEALGWDEANIVSEDEPTLKAVRLWLATLPTRAIKPNDIRDAKLAWKRRRKGMPFLQNKIPICQALAKGSASLAGRGVHVAVYSAEMSQEGQHVVEQR